MGRLFEKLEAEHHDFIKQQKIFFVATAPETGRISLSPKGMDSFRCLDDRHAIFRNFTGSGNETAAHLIENGRITIMFCSFEEKPLILRIYGTGEAVHPRDEAEWNRLNALFPSERGVRQFIKIDIDSVQTSCGFGVPLFEFKGEREALRNYIENKTDEELHKYREEKNKKTIDGLPTFIL